MTGERGFIIIGWERDYPNEEGLSEFMYEMIKDFLWSIFGNDEEWPPPEWFMKKHPIQSRILGEGLGWLFIRNPFHNLTWHRWGFVGETDNWEKSGPYKDHVWNPDGGWNKITWTNRETGERKVFRSYRGKRIEFYFGPRERGNYGIAFRRAYS